MLIFRIANLRKKVSSRIVKESVTDYDIVCAKQLLSDLQVLDKQFPDVNEKVSELAFKLENFELLSELELTRTRVS